MCLLAGGHFFSKSVGLLGPRLSFLVLSFTKVNGVGFVYHSKFLYCLALGVILFGFFPVTSSDGGFRVVPVAFHW